MPWRRYDRDELLARTDLPALLDELSGPATAPGRSARWHCPVPDHDDVHPSVTVTRRPARGSSGGGAGPAVTAAPRSTPSTSRSRRRLPRGDRGARSPRRPATRRARRPSASAAPLPPRRAVPLHPQRVRYVEACERLLWQPIGRPVLDYLIDERGLDPEVLRVNRVGADPGTGTAPPCRRAPQGRTGRRVPGARRRRARSPTSRPATSTPTRAPIEVRQPGQPARRQPTPRLDPARWRSRRSRS